MSVLITGAGLIGRITATLLARRGTPVVLADIHQPSEDPDAPVGITRVACDVVDAATLMALIKDQAVDAIVHTAAMLSTGIRQDPVKGVQVNVVGTATVLECARAAGLRRVVLASSTTVAYTVFGSHGPAPIEEDAALHLLSERPASVYAVTKLAGEQLALLYGDLYGLDTVALRFGAVLGALENGAPPSSVPGRLLAAVAAAGKSGAPLRLEDPFLLWGGGEEFVDARDCARACIAALDASSPQQRVYNIAPGTCFTLPEFLAVAGRVHPALTIAPFDLPTTGFAGFPHQRPAPSSTVAAERELGFHCAHDLEDSIRYWSARQG